MCLTTNTTVPLVAKKDIEVYKVVNDFAQQRFWRGPVFSQKEFPFDKTVTVTEDVRIKTCVHVFGYYLKPVNVYEINGGMFHCIGNLKEAKTFKQKGFRNATICKAVIPKGTEYYVDCVNGAYMAAKSIKVLNPKNNRATTEVAYKDLYACLLLLMLENEPSKKEYTISQYKASYLMPKLDREFDDIEFSYLGFYEHPYIFAGEFGEFSEVKFGPGPMHNYCRIVVKNHKGLLEKLEEILPDEKTCNEIIDKIKTLNI